MSVFRFILKNLDQYRSRFWWAVLAGLTSSVAILSVPLLLTEFTQKGLNTHAFRHLVVYLVIAVSIWLSASWVVRRYGESLAFQFRNHLRLKYFQKLEELPLSQLAKSHSGYLLSMIDQLGERLNDILFDIFWVFTGTVANVGFLIYFTATRSFGLTILNMSLFVVFVLVSTILARKMTALADEKNRRNAVFGQYFVDFMGNLSTIKRLGIRNFAQGQLEDKGQSSNQQIQAFQDAHSNRWFVLHGIYFIANLTTIGFLIYEISKGVLPVSILIIFLAFYGSLRSIIERLAENIITFTEARVYISNLTELLEGRERQSSAKAGVADWKRIELSDLKYQYPQNDTVIQIPSLKIERGQKVCIFGQSGEGKTTVLNLIANFITSEDGLRKVDNKPYTGLAKTWFQDQLAFISQEVELFNLSLRDNLTLGRDIDDRQIDQLLSDLGLLKWVAGLEQGLDTVVGEKGLKLSAGQKQRVNLARGILLDKQLYLLDEPTSHLDAETEKLVVKALEKHLRGKTVVFVTHRPAIKSICQIFYEMKNHTIRPS